MTTQDLRFPARKGRVSTAEREGLALNDYLAWVKSKGYDEDEALGRWTVGDAVRRVGSRVAKTAGAGAALGGTAGLFTAGVASPFAALGGGLAGGATGGLMGAVGELAGAAKARQQQILEEYFVETGANQGA